MDDTNSRLPIIILAIVAWPFTLVVAAIVLPFYFLYILARISVMLAKRLIADGKEAAAALAYVAYHLGRYAITLFLISKIDKC